MSFMFVSCYGYNIQKSEMFLLKAKLCDMQISLLALNLPLHGIRIVQFVKILLIKILPLPIHYKFSSSKSFAML